MQVSTKVSGVIDGVNCVEEFFYDGSCWSFTAKFNSKAYLVATYVAGSLSIHNPSLRSGQPSVCSPSLIEWFKNNTESKISSMSNEWLDLHKALYNI